MTVREFLQNKNINLDDELYIRIMSLDTDDNYYSQDFPITSLELENHNIMIVSSYLDEYERSWTM